MAGSTGGARTLERGLALLDCVAAGHRRLEEIAAAAGLSRSATHRMLSSLVAAGFLGQDPDRGYRLGLKLLELGARAERAIGISAAVQAVLASLADATRDAAHLGVLAGPDVLYLAKARGHRGIEMASRPGVRLRAQNTAIGKALLAAQPEEAALAAFDPAAAATERSITSPERFLAELAAVRERGYAVEVEENQLGVGCVAVPVPDLAGSVVAAASIAAPTVHLPAGRVEELARLLHERRAELTARLPAGFERSWS